MSNPTLLIRDALKATPESQLFNTVEAAFGFLEKRTAIAVLKEVLERIDQ